jgi:ribosomal protein S18 acetylase RimI-like enzyme
MDEAPRAVPISIRTAVPEDAEGITRTFLESAEFHASLEPERYWVPSAEEIAARYREGRQHPPDAEGITLVALADGETDGLKIVGFVDARLEQSLDVMHRDMIFCFIADIAVNRSYQSQGIGRRLVRAAEEWGREQGAEFASLQYLAANPRAGELYQRMGYGVAAIMAIKRL